MELMRAGEQRTSGRRNTNGDCSGRTTRRKQHQIRPMMNELEQADKTERREEEGEPGRRGRDENERHVERKWCEKKINVSAWVRKRGGTLANG